MSDGAIVSMLVVAVLLGVGGAAFFVMKSPAFWGHVIREIFSKAWPQIWAVLSKRMSEEEEKDWHRAERRGNEGDDWIKNRRRRNRD